MSLPQIFLSPGAVASEKSSPLKIYPFFLKLRRLLLRLRCAGLQDVLVEQFCPPLCCILFYSLNGKFASRIILAKSIISLLNLCYFGAIRMKISAHDFLIHYFNHAMNALYGKIHDAPYSGTHIIEGRVIHYRSRSTRYEACLEEFRRYLASKYSTAPLTDSDLDDELEYLYSLITKSFPWDSSIIKASIDEIVSEMQMAEGYSQTRMLDLPDRTPIYAEEKKVSQGKVKQHSVKQDNVPIVDVPETSNPFQAKGTNSCTVCGNAFQGIGEYCPSCQHDRLERLARGEPEKEKANVSYAPTPIERGYRDVPTMNEDHKSHSKIVIISICLIVSVIAVALFANSAFNGNFFQINPTIREINANKSHYCGNCIGSPYYNRTITLTADVEYVGSTPLRSQWGLVQGPYNTPLPDTLYIYLPTLRQATADYLEQKYFDSQPILIGGLGQSPSVTVTGMLIHVMSAGSTNGDYYFMIVNIR